MTGTGWWQLDEFSKFWFGGRVAVGLGKKMKFCE